MLLEKWLQQLVHFHGGRGCTGRVVRAFFESEQAAVWEWKADQVRKPCLHYVTSCTAWT